MNAGAYGVAGVGVDIVDVVRFERLVAEYGDSFTCRWFTTGERAACAARRRPGSAYAELFAIKEAAWKSLGAAAWAGPLAWRDLEVIGVGGDGYRDVRLHGPAAVHARRALIEAVKATSALAGGVATAMAVATR